MQIDISFLPGLATAFLLAFARIGTMVMLMPGVVLLLRLLPRM